MSFVWIDEEANAMRSGDYPFPDIEPGEAHCWEDGPMTQKAGVDGKIGSSCMLKDGHEGPHLFLINDQIVLEFS